MLYFDENFASYEGSKIAKLDKSTESAKMCSFQLRGDLQIDMSSLNVNWTFTF